MRISLPHSIALLAALCVWQLSSAYEVRVQTSTCSDPQVYTVDDGATVTILATADIGSNFDYWEDGTNANPRTLVVTSDTTITATFNVDTEDIYPDKETYNFYGGDCTTPVTGQFIPGTELTLIAVPLDGYKFKQWSDGNTSNPRTIIAIDNEYRAEFERYPSPAVETKEIIIGTNDCDTIGIYYLPLGAELTLKAQITDTECGKFDKWENNETTQERTTTITSSAEYVASFGKIQYTITTKSDNTEHGSATIITE